jgi:hypothetical protein
MILTNGRFYIIKLTPHISNLKTTPPDKRKKSRKKFNQRTRFRQIKGQIMDPIRL